MKRQKKNRNLTIHHQFDIRYTIKINRTKKKKSPKIEIAFNFTYEIPLNLFGKKAWNYVTKIRYYDGEIGNHFGKSRRRSVILKINGATHQLVQICKPTRNLSRHLSIYIYILYLKIKIKRHFWSPSNPSTRPSQWTFSRIKNQETFQVFENVIYGN